MRFIRDERQNDSAARRHASPHVAEPAAARCYRNLLSRSKLKQLADIACRCWQKRPPPVRELRTICRRCARRAFRGSSATSSLPNNSRSSSPKVVLMLVIVIVLDEFLSDYPLRARIRSGVGIRARGGLHAHDLITAVDVDDLTGDRCRSVAREKHSGLTEFRRVATAFQRSSFLIML